VNDERIDTDDALRDAENTLGEVRNGMNLKDKEVDELTTLLTENERNTGDREDLKKTMLFALAQIQLQWNRKMK
jgi:hypothetical protein